MEQKPPLYRWSGVERQAKFTMRRDKALTTIVLAVKSSLLYLIGSDPTNPVVAWRTLAERFQHKTWANKLKLKQKLFSLRLAEGGSVQEHTKLMTEISLTWPVTRKPDPHF